MKAQTTIEWVVEYRSRGQRDWRRLSEHHDSKADAEAHLEKVARNIVVRGRGDDGWPGDRFLGYGDPQDLRLVRIETATDYGDPFPAEDLHQQALEYYRSNLGAAGALYVKNDQWPGAKKETTS